MLSFEVKPLKLSETEGIYPITLEKAVQDLSGNTLDEKLSAITADLNDNVVRTDEQELTAEQQAQARANIGVIGVTDVVMTTPQELTEEQKQQARANIDVIGVTDVVKTTEQELTEEQQAQARENIGVLSAEETLSTGEQELSEEQKQQVRENLGFGDGTIDTEVTEGSQNLVTSDAVYQALSEISSATTAETAISAITAEFAEVAETAQSAETATSALTAEFAATAETAQSAETATSAITAETAESADFAQTAETATSALTAEFAEEAEFAQTAEFAERATSAVTSEASLSAQTSVSAQTMSAEGLVGIIPIEHIQQGAIEKLVVVTDEAEMLNLTTGSVQNGDTVKVVEPSGIMYYVKDETKLGTMDAFEVYMAGKAASVDWVNISGTPSEFAPTEHGSDKVGKLSGYTSGNTSEPLNPNDSLNEALSKLENQIANVKDEAESEKDSTFINQLSAYTKSEESGSTLELANGDTLNEALGKLEKKADDTIEAMVDNEFVVSTALNDLRSDIDDARSDIVDMRSDIDAVQVSAETALTMADTPKDSTYINELSGYTESEASGAALNLADGDTLNEALGKLEKKADDSIERIVKDELVTAAALNDLRGDIDDPKPSTYIDELSGYTKSEASGSALDLADGDTLNDALGKLEKKADDAIEQMSGITNYTDNIFVSGYTKAEEAAPIEDEDDLNEALGKLEYKVDIASEPKGANYIDSMSGYTGPSAEVNDVVSGDTLNEAIGKLEKKADDALAAADGPKDSTFINELSGYTKSEESGSTLDLTDGDTLNEALGKLEKKTDDLSEVVEENELIVAAAINDLRDDIDSLSAITNYTDNIFVSGYTIAVEEADIEDGDDVNEALGKLEYKIDEITFIPDDVIDAIVRQSPIGDVPPSTHNDDPTQAEAEYIASGRSVDVSGDLGRITYDQPTRTVNMFVSNASYDPESETIVIS